MKGHRVEVSWIGLGAMGYPMAGHVAAGFATRVHNRTADVAARHADEHGSRAVGLAEAATADVVCTCLPTTVEVGEVAEAVLDDLRPGAVWVDATSGDPAASREVAARLAERDVVYVDAPVSGGTDGAAAGTLTVMAGGDSAAVGRARPVLDTFAGRVVHVGPAGAGHAVKAVNNAMLAIDLWAAGEGLAALVAQGVPADTALEVINASSGRSFATERLIGPRVVTREWPVTFTLGLLAKDVGIAESVLDDTKVPAPALRLAGELLRVATAELGGAADHVEALKLIERWSGIEIR